MLTGDNGNYFTNGIQLLKSDGTDTHLKVMNIYDPRQVPTETCGQYTLLDEKTGLPTRRLAEFTSIDLNKRCRADNQSNYVFLRLVSRLPPKTFGIVDLGQDGYKLYENISINTVDVSQLPTSVFESNNLPFKSLLSLGIVPRVKSDPFTMSLTLGNNPKVGDNLQQTTYKIKFKATSAEFIKAGKISVKVDSAVVFQAEINAIYVQERSFSLLPPTVNTLNSSAATTRYDRGALATDIQDITLHPTTKTVLRTGDVRGRFVATGMQVKLRDKLYTVKSVVFNANRNLDPSGKQGVFEITVDSDPPTVCPSRARFYFPITIESGGHVLTQYRCVTAVVLTVSQDLIDVEHDDLLRVMVTSTDKTKTAERVILDIDRIAKLIYMAGDLGYDKYSNKKRVRVYTAMTKADEFQLYNAEPQTLSLRSRAKLMYNSTKNYIKTHLKDYKTAGTDLSLLKNSPPLAVNDFSTLYDINARCIKPDSKTYVYRGMTCAKLQPDCVRNENINYDELWKNCPCTCANKVRSPLTLPTTTAYVPETFVILSPVLSQDEAQDVFKDLIRQFDFLSAPIASRITYGAGTASVAASLAQSYNFHYTVPDGSTTQMTFAENPYASARTALLLKMNSTTAASVSDVSTVELFRTGKSVTSAYGAVSVIGARTLVPIEVTIDAVTITSNANYISADVQFKSPTTFDHAISVGIFSTTAFTPVNKQQVVMMSNGYDVIDCDGAQVKVIKTSTTVTTVKLQFRYKSNNTIATRFTRLKTQVSASSASSPVTFNAFFAPTILCRCASADTMLASSLSGCLLELGVPVRELGLSRQTYCVTRAVKVDATTVGLELALDQIPRHTASQAQAFATVTTPVKSTVQMMLKGTSRSRNGVVVAISNELDLSLSLTIKQQKAVLTLSYYDAEQGRVSRKTDELTITTGEYTVQLHTSPTSSRLMSVFATIGNAGNIQSTPRPSESAAVRVAGVLAHNLSGHIVNKTGRTVEARLTSIPFIGSQNFIPARVMISGLANEDLVRTVRQQRRLIDWVREKGYRIVSSRSRNISQLQKQKVPAATYGLHGRLRFVYDCNNEESNATYLMVVNNFYVYIPAYRSYITVVYGDTFVDAQRRAEDTDHP